MQTLEEYRIGLEQDRRAEYLRDLYFIDHLLDQEAKDEVKEFAEELLLKKGIDKAEIEEWGWEEVIEKEDYEEVLEFTIDKIIERDLDIKEYGAGYAK